MDVEHIEAKFDRFMAQCDFLAQGIALAVSGGSDSMAMLAIMLGWISRMGRPVNRFIVLTVDHRLRKGSADDAQFVIDFCIKHGVEAFLLSDDGSVYERGNKSMYARNLRYKLMLNCCNEQRVPNLMLAHNKEEQIETFLLNMARGSGLDGLSAMFPVRHQSNIRVIRPLLGFTKAELRQYLNHNGINWCEDPSNRIGKRAVYRSIISNLSHLEVERMALAIEHLQRVKSAMNHYVRNAFMELIRADDRGFLEIEYQRVKSLEREIAMRVILASLMVVSGNYFKPRYNDFDVFFLQLCNCEGDLVTTFNGCLIVKRGPTVFVLREIVAIPGNVKIESGSEILWDNRLRFVLFSKPEHGEIFSLSPINAKVKYRLVGLHGYIEAGLPVLRSNHGRVSSIFINGIAADENAGLHFCCRFCPGEILGDILCDGVL